MLEHGSMEHARIGTVFYFTVPIKGAQYLVLAKRVRVGNTVNPQAASRLCHSNGIKSSGPSAD